VAFHERGDRGTSVFLHRTERHRRECEEGHVVSATPKYQRFVALGDSTSEGLGDHPHPDGTPRGWADRFAEQLAAGSPGLRYANLAVRGRRIVDVRRDQLAPACALNPDLASVIVGINDVIRPRFDLDRALENLDAIHAPLRDGGAAVLTTTFPDPSRIRPVQRPWRSRILALNAGIREIAERRNAILADTADSPLANDPRVWCEDRLHLTPLGHERVARALYAAVVGAALPMTDAAGVVHPTDVNHSLVAELRWARRYLVPWIGRRLTGRSSGDGRLPKRPDLAPLFATSAPAGDSQ
jgi:lysophospholipase L1-like esterase